MDYWWYTFSSYVTILQDVNITGSDVLLENKVQPIEHLELIYNMKITSLKPNSKCEIKK